MAPTSPGGLLGVLEPDDVAALKQGGHRRRFPRQSTLFNEGDRSDRLFILLSGRIKLAHYGRSGEEEIFDVIGPGELLGELSAIDNGVRSCTGVALEPVEALVLTAEFFNRFLEERPKVAAHLLRTIVARLRDADRHRIELGTQDTGVRLARRLVELAERFGQPDGDGVRIGLALSQEELAGWIGASREAVVKGLRRLREQGLIATARREIRVLDMEKLAKRAE